MQLKKNIKNTSNWVVQKYKKVLLTCSLLMITGIGCALQKQSSSGGYMLSRKSNFPRNAIINEFQDPERLALALQRAHMHPAHGGVVPPNGEDVDAMFFNSGGKVNPFIDTEDDFLSTYALDVDTASFAMTRAYLQDGHMPPEASVRVEEFVNAFDYDYPQDESGTFGIYLEGARWQFGRPVRRSFLVRVGLQARHICNENRKPTVLTFVIDVSGSMAREKRLGLVKRSLRLLVDQLNEQDLIGIVVFDSQARAVLQPTGLDRRDTILAAINSLQPGGSTNAEQGLRLGYRMAERARRVGWINRVILCSDGVANVDQTGAEAILKAIEQQRKKGITLSAIGFGMGNYSDVFMEQLSNNGDGHYAYVDSIAEARRILIENLTGTLQLVARDTKVQVAFNPEVVRSYRLIGYENRDVADEKFRDDQEDGGEVGAGHAVTTLYEVKLWEGKTGRVATVFLRFHDEELNEVVEIEEMIDTSMLRTHLDSASSSLKLAAIVTEFSEVLRRSIWAKGETLSSILERAQKLSHEYGSDADLIELCDLISKANAISSSHKR